MDELQEQVLLEPLTEREVEILRLIAGGLANRDIAQRLYLSLETVKWYNKRIYAKLDVGSRTQAVARARELGLLDQPASPTAATPPVPPPPRRHNLPVPPTPIVGREQEVGKLRELLRQEDVRLVTLTGPGGVGKTRLALEVASQLMPHYRDGVFFVSLASLQDPELLPATIAAELDVQERGGESLLQTLKGMLAEQELLLLLDNFEHLTEAAPLVAELLAAAPRLNALATSREWLRLSGERHYPVSPLVTPSIEQVGKGLAPEEAAAFSAVELFRQRAEALLPTFELTAANAAAVAEICARLDGLPLAIELAAARLPLFGTPEALLGRLGSGLKLLKGGARDLPARQQTLQATIQWSYDLLAPEEQKLFRRLAVFTGGCTLEAAEAVCGHDGEPGIDILHGVEALLDKSLLRREPGAEGEPRFGLLRTIHEYASEQLQLSGELQEAHQRHALTYLELVERAVPELKGPAHAIWLERFDHEHDNLRAAINWSLDRNQAEMAFRIAGELWRYWIVRGYSKEADRWFNRILSTKGEVSTQSRTKVLNGAGAVAWTLGDLERSRKYHTECLALRMQIEDAPGVAASYHNLAVVAHSQSEIDVAVAYFRESVALYRDLGDDWGTADGLLQLGNIMRNQKAFEEAQTYLERGLAMLRDLGDSQGVAGAYYLLAELAGDDGRHEQARRYLTESKMICVELGYVWGIALADHELGQIALHENDFQQAETLLIDSLRRKHELGEKSGVAYSLEALASLAAARLDTQKAAKLWGAAGALREMIQAPLPPADHREQERAVADLRASMAAGALEQGWEEGRRLAREDFEGLIAFALTKDAPADPAASTIATGNEGDGLT